jgi:Protein of unknown function (DUF3467)
MATQMHLAVRMVNSGEGNWQIEARYANFFRVGRTGFEIVLDFGQSYQGEQGPAYHTRIVTSPDHASSLLNLLKDSLEHNESSSDPEKTDSRYE